MQNLNVIERTLVTSMVLLLSPVVSHGGPKHEEDTVIGRTASGLLAVEIGSPGLNALPPVDGLIQGWALDEPGLKSLDADEPAKDFFMLNPGTIINLELVSIDPALKVWSPGFLTALTAPGNSFVVGASEFDVHPTFHIDSNDAEFNPVETVFTATFRVHDSGATGYSDSEPFSLSFGPVPEPATALFVGFGFLGLWGRRGRRAGQKRSTS